MKDSLKRLFANNIQHTIILEDIEFEIFGMNLC